MDFADVKAVMKDSGTAMLGVGVSSSKNRAEEAAEQATLAPLIGSSIQSATGVVYNITGGKDITLQEVNRVSQVLLSLFYSIHKYYSITCTIIFVLLDRKLSLLSLSMVRLRPFNTKSRLDESYSMTFGSWNEISDLFE